MRKILLLLLVMAVLGGYLFYHHAISGPEYSLLQAKEAAEKHDLTTFEKYVDIQSLTGSLVDQVTAPGTGLNEFLPALGVNPAMLEFIKPQLVTSASQEIKRYISTGRVQTSPTGPLLSVAAIAGTLISGDTEFKGIESVEKNGDTALVGLKFTQPQYDTTLVLEIKMVNKGDYWQATQLANTGELLQHVTRLEKQRLFRNRH